MFLFVEVLCSHVLFLVVFVLFLVTAALIIDVCDVGLVYNRVYLLCFQEPGDQESAAGAEGMRDENINISDVSK